MLWVDINWFANVGFIAVVKYIELMELWVNEKEVFQLKGLWMTKKECYKNFYLYNN